MNAKNFHTNIGQRDIEILTAIDRSPISVKQLLKLSSTFSRPFNDENNLRRRLRRLKNAGLLRAWQFALQSDGRSSNYFKLTRDGYHMLYGMESLLPKRRYFEAIAMGHHFHTKCLTDAIVHIIATAKQQGIELRSFARENSTKLEAGEFTVYPDCAFQLTRTDGKPFNFVVELDNSTERVRSKRDTESIERKIRAYCAHQSKYQAFDASRFVVLFITTRSPRRLNHILELAGELIFEQQRALFLGVNLPDLLDNDPFKQAIWQDHCGLRKTLIPMLHKPVKSNRIATQPASAGGIVKPQSEGPSHTHQQACEGASSTVLR